MAKWVTADEGLYYERIERHMKAVVYLDGHIWRSRVFVHGDETDRGEWDGRDTALLNALGAMKRATKLRRYDGESAPTVDVTHDPPDDDDDDA